MSSDDLTRNKEKTDQDDKDTQPTITAVFGLIQDVESRQNARLDETEARFNARLDETEARLNSRIDGVESRLAGDIDGVNTRLIEGFKELRHKIDALNRRALQSEAGYEDLSERVGRLESKAS
jgi:hypothetical protein